MPLDQLATVAPAGPGEEPAARTIRVATVPASHVYVRHLDPVHPLSGLPRIDRLSDPDPDDPRRSTVSTWWPPVMLQPEWVREHADEFDVFHLQFGFDARTPAELAELVGTAALSETDNAYIEFRSVVERNLLSQGRDELRTFDQTMDLAWQALSLLPRRELTMLSGEFLDKYLPGPIGGARL